MITEARYVIAVPDLERSAAYYRDDLGFAIRTIGDPGWRFFVREACFIMAGECPDALPAAELGDHSYFAYVVLDDIDAYYGPRIRRRRDDHQATTWGMREFALRTVDGRRMMFGQRLSTAITSG